MNALRPLLLAALLVLSGCERTFRDMYDQPRYKPLAASPLWPDGRGSRPEVEGAVPRSEGTFADTSSGRNGVLAAPPTVNPLDTVRDALRPKDPAGMGGMASAIRAPAPSLALLARGRNRFDIFCAPCHSVAGDGDGMVARRGFPHPPSFHTDVMRAASDAHFYAVITNGYGAMYPYATRIEPADRLAIVAYIRALQLSQHAPFEAVPDAERSRLGEMPSSTQAERSRRRTPSRSSEAPGAANGVPAASGETPR